MSIMGYFLSTAQKHYKQNFGQALNPTQLSSFPTKVVELTQGMFAGCYCFVLVRGGAMAHNSCKTCTCGLHNTHTISPQVAIGA